MTTPNSQPSFDPGAVPPPAPQYYSPQPGIVPPQPGWQSASVPPSGPGWFSRNRNLVVILAAALVVVLGGGVGFGLGMSNGAQAHRQAVTTGLHNQIKPLMDSKPGRVAPDESPRGGRDDDDTSDARGDDDVLGGDDALGDDGALDDADGDEMPSGLALVKVVTDGISETDDTATRVTKAANNLMALGLPSCANKDCVAPARPEGAGGYAITAPAELLADKTGGTGVLVLQDMAKIIAVSLDYQGAQDLKSVSVSDSEGKFRGVHFIDDAGFPGV
ncbi:hypothetical protein [Mycetocola saprophilus]|uniref:hypothetical protein n=1 Tax=Mycetocola saprophilus TaxID=76636 RepID=UPI003BF255D6